MFDRRPWSLRLEDGVEAEVPVPNGHLFDIAGIHAVDLTAAKISVEVISLTVRIDKLGDNDDIAPLDILHAVIAVLFPKEQPIAKVSVAFSALNVVSLKATGGAVTVTGTWAARAGISGA
jgi:hypothetical protein